jgi:hypothetical protein
LAFTPTLSQVGEGLRAFQAIQQTVSKLNVFNIFKVKILREPGIWNSSS